MKKRNNYYYMLLPVVITFCLYVVFYQRIATKPSDAGFWLILALGMAIGMALNRIIQKSKTEKDDQ